MRSAIPIRRLKMWLKIILEPVEADWASEEKGNCMSNLDVRHHNDILWLILDRTPLNILSIAMLDQLTAAMRDAIKDPPRLIVLTGAGERAFCAGVDIYDHLDGREVEMLRAVRDNCAAFEELRTHHIPTVALV